ncbi:hypothetical protein V5R04_15490 [Jonesiaceae bacterium BS-20]|uniref:Small CPxCG-related zinc finger protein n=1 Tax=Jonesiaceae bacterium BS-20 TaxID=3120821 RepID=A0AAU7DWJ9_9MICO
MTPITSDDPVQEDQPTQFCPVCGDGVETFSIASVDWTDAILQACAICANDRTALGLPLLPAEETEQVVFEPHQLLFCTACGQAQETKRFFYFQGSIRALCLDCFTSETES